jgi:hypothetical protein
MDGQGPIKIDLLICGAVLVSDTGDSGAEVIHVSESSFWFYWEKISRTEGSGFCL